MLENELFFFGYRGKFQSRLHNAEMVDSFLKKEPVKSQVLQWDEGEGLKQNKLLSPGFADGVVSCWFT